MINDEERIPASVINRLYLDNEPPLRVWREYRGFTGRKLAEAVGISSAYLSDIENGKKMVLSLLSNASLMFYALMSMTLSSLVCRQATRVAVNS